ncbi:MAG: ATP-binding protein [Kofleriaceae bacterium]
MPELRDLADGHPRRVARRGASRSGPVKQSLQHNKIAVQQNCCAGTGRGQMKIVVGNTVEQENFWGRTEELARLERLLEGDHVLLLAPRRVGKSSLLKAYQARARTDGAVVVYADVQDTRPGPDAEAQFARTVLDAIHATPAGKRVRPGVFARMRAARTSRVKQLQLPGGAGAELEHLPHAWQQAADQAFARVLAGDTTWVVLIDELPNVVTTLADLDPTGARARAFLAWFRALRNRCDARIRFVVCGSIGLDSVAARLRCTDTINDLHAWTIGAFSREDADGFLETIAAAYQVELGPSVRARICYELEWLIPHHLQALAQELIGKRTAVAITEADVGAAVEALLANRTYFNSWDERLTGTLGVPLDDHARAVLVACSRDPQGASRAVLRQCLASAGVGDATRAQTLTRLLDVLRHDGYLVVEDDRVRFRSALLRRYWERNFA